MLAMPITGIVLPAFTLPRHGAGVVVALLAGFVRGQAGFVVLHTGWSGMKVASDRPTLAAAGRQGAEGHDEH